MHLKNQACCQDGMCRYHQATPKSLSNKELKDLIFVNISQEERFQEIEINAKLIYKA